MKLGFMLCLVMLFASAGNAFAERCKIEIKHADVSVSKLYPSLIETALANKGYDAASDAEYSVFLNVRHADFRGSTWDTNAIIFKKESHEEAFHNPNQMIDIWPARITEDAAVRQTLDALPTCDELKANLLTAQPKQ